MSDIKRYEVDQYGMDQNENGYYVTYGDYKSAIDRLTAERDVLLIEKGRLQGIRQKLESERDAAVADAERRLQLIRDTLANTEWRHGARNIYAEFCKESREAMKEQEQGK